MRLFSSPCSVNSKVVRVLIYLAASLCAFRCGAAQDDEQTAEAAAPAVETETAEATDGEPMQTELESPRLMQESQQSPRLHAAGVCLLRPGRCL